MLLGHLAPSTIRLQTRPFFIICHSLRRLSHCAASMNPQTSSAPVGAGGNSVRQRKKARFEAPENVLKYRLDMCSKNGDAISAIAHYDEANTAGIRLSAQHYNALLYVCSLPAAGADRTDVIDRGFEIYGRMQTEGVPPNEATITSVTRLAAEKGDFDLAFDLVRRMPESGLTPRLRSFGPALLGFCRVGDVGKAYEVDDYMLSLGVTPEEGELSALLRASSEAGRGDKVYSFLHRLRTTVRAVTESTAEIVESWFQSMAAADVGVESWDPEEVRKGVIAGGGGWHGKGWLGKGKWKVMRSRMDENGVCQECGERLVLIDIDPVETENFAKSLAQLACQREAKTAFTKFQDWLAKNGPFDAVVDGANVGLFNQGSYELSFFQLNSIVNAVRDISPTKKLPLVVLHSRRLTGGPANKPHNKKLIENWQKSCALYSTPVGSNDDWYWLYAAVSCNALLVTNDEMRDHLFQLLGNSFFPRWKERHQVRLAPSKRPKFLMPPPYSTVIQESETGNWHIPVAVEGDETPRPWVCATRQNLNCLEQTKS